jgi:hypothetical protein
MSVFLSMIIDEFHIVDIAAVPDKAKSPIAAHSKTKLVKSVSSQLFKEAPRDSSQVLFGFGGVHKIKTVPKTLVKFLRALRILALKEPFDFLVFEVPNHVYSVLHNTHKCN